MATLPAEGRWSIKPLTDDDVRSAVSFLQRDPLINVYLISRLLEERTASATQMIEVRFNREIVLVAALATNVVLASAPGVAMDLTEAAISIVADRILTRMLPVRAIISPASLVESLWRQIRSRLDPPTVVRMNQPIYAIRRRFDFPDLSVARYATMKDLDNLVPACASMHGGLDEPAYPKKGIRARVATRGLRPSLPTREDRDTFCQRLQPPGHRSVRDPWVPTHRHEPGVDLVTVNQRLPWCAHCIQHVRSRKQAVAVEIGMAEQEQGVVKWFNNDKGYGFIKRDTGEDVFVHHTAIANQAGYRTLNEGDRVEFDVKQGPKGLQAENVRRSDQQQAS